MRTLLAATLCLALLAAARNARAHTITIAWSAEAVTVVDEPFGMTVPRLTVIDGFFTYDLNTPDSDDSEFDGVYVHEGDAGFLANILQSKVTGSHTPTYWVDLTPNVDNDTFRIYDGPRVVGFEGGIMSIDGVPDDDIELFLAITDDAFEDDDLKNPFPLYDFGFLGTTHTFSLEDDQGTILLQLLEAREVVCGDPSFGGGITAGDALSVLQTSVGLRSCLSCVCDTDHSGSVSPGDALRVLRFAVGSLSEMSCAVCL